MSNKQSFQPNQRWFDFPAILLLLLVLTVAFTRLSATGWTQHLSVSRPIAYLGLIAGIALGISRLSPRLSIVFSVIYGIYTVTWQIGLTMGEGIPWQERLLSLYGRLGVIFTHLIQQKPVPDNLLFVILMGLLFWILSSHAGFTMIRFANPWMTILPTGLAIIVIHHYEVIQPDVELLLPRRTWYIFVYLLFALMLVARLVFLQKRSTWLQRNTYLPPYLSMDLASRTLGILLILMIFTWALPVSAQRMSTVEEAYQNFSGQFRDFRNILSNLTASLRASVGLSSDYYGPSLSLGRGASLSDNILFNVQVPPAAPEGIRYYWRARVYDRYDNGWTSSLNSTRALAPDNLDFVYPAMKEDFPGLFPFSFTINAPISTLFTPGQPMWISRPTQANLLINPDGTIDLASLNATPALRAGEQYSVRASFNQVTVSALRKTNRDYPEWIKERYLQIPPTITGRTLELARQIAAGKEIPYDITVAVTDYLRANIEYVEVLPAIPNNVEPMDWFLFDIRQGFCNYYASAEVILLRSLGIPARLAAGYAQGEYAEVEPIYSVRYRDAHAWPEVYFSGIGWVEFEPTASQPEIALPLGGHTEEQGTAPLSNLSTPTPEEAPFEDSLNAEDRFTQDESTARQSRVTFTIVTITLSVILIILIGSLFLARKEVRKRLPYIPLFFEKSLKRFGFHPPEFLHEWAQQANLTPLQRAYHEINNALRRLGQAPAPTDTPNERSAALVEVLPLTQLPASILITEYQAETYNRNIQGNLAAAEQASDEIRNLSWKAYLRKLLMETNPRSRQGSSARSR